jgi:V8-like Glu-specific endopeptidase
MRFKAIGYMVCINISLLLIFASFNSLSAADGEDASTQNADPAINSISTWYQPSGSPLLRFSKERDNEALPMMIPSVPEIEIIYPPGSDPSATIFYDNIEHRISETSSEQYGQGSFPAVIEPFEGLLPTGDILSTQKQESVIGDDDRLQITNTTDFPWRTIVKLYMHFSGGTGFCSGSIIDPFHVLTAGHCVYDHKYGLGWANSIEVIPALSDDPNSPQGDTGSDFDQFYMPFYHAYATGARSYTGWTQEGDPNYDWAVVTLDRNIGNLLGSMGRKTVNTITNGVAGCGESYYTGIFHLAGYPSDLSAGLSPAMYYDSDSGSGCSEYRHSYYMDTYEGQSGSPVWSYDSSTGNRYIATVHTNGDTSSNSGTRLNQDKYDRIFTWLSADLLNPPLDLPILIDDGQDFSGFSPKSVTQGETSFSAWSDILNIGTAASGSFYVSYYASTNTTISTSDYLICKTLVSSTSPFDRNDASCSTIFPDTIPSGTYYVGWIIDAENNVAQKESLPKTGYKSASYGLLEVGKPVVTITANDSTATEAGPTTGQFTITRTGETTSALAVYFSVGGTATSASDYSSIGTSVTIPAGSASATKTVTPINDTAAEGDETVVVTLSANEAYTVGSPSSATVTIADLPTITITANDSTATEAGPTIGQFTITRSGETTSALTVYFSVGGTATSASDYTSIGTSVTIPAGLASATKTVTPINDTTAEGDETVVVTLSTNEAYTVGSPSSATVTITDLPTITITANDSTATEAGPTTGQFTITRSGETTSALTTYFSVGGTATSGSDYNSIGTSVTIPAGSASTTKTVTPINDTAVETDETVVVTLSANAAYTVGSPSSATVTITSDDAGPTVTIQANDAAATEAGPTTGSFRIFRTGATTSALTVFFSVAGTATSGSDFTSIGTSVTIPAGSASNTKTVTPINDTTPEGDETVVVTLSANAAYTVGSPGSATVIITDDDGVALPTVTITANDSTATEAGPTTGQFTLTRSGATTSALTAYFSVGGTANSGSDYNSIGTSVTIPVGSVSSTITVTPIDDTAAEGDETVLVTLSANAAYTVGSPGSATVTITDNDQVTLPTVTITANDSTATEAGTTTGQFTLTRSGATTSALTVNFSVGGTATSGSDYNSIGTTVTIPASSVSSTITVTPIDDAAAEGDETVLVTLSANATYTVGSPDSATVTIADDDGALPTITITSNDSTATEAGPTTGQFTITRSGATTSALTAYFSVAGTAAAGSDYNSIGTSITIPAGSASTTKTVTPINDTAVEADETVVVTLSANAAYIVGSPRSATVTITSDDAGPTVTIQANDATATEAGPTTGSFRIFRTGATTSALIVYFSVGGTASSGSDYTGIGTSVTIPAGSASNTKTVTPTNDTTPEGDETVLVTLTANAAYTVGSPDSATVTIADDDGTLPTITITANDPTATETGPTTGQFTITRSGATTAPLTAYFSVAGTATLGSDYSSIGSSVTIPAGSASNTITVTPIDDTSVEGDETVVVTLSANAAYTVGSPGSATVTITDNDQVTLPTVTITANDSTATEAGPTTGQFTITRTGATASALTAYFSVGGTATPGSDYSSIGTSVTIPAGSVSNTLTVTPINDTVAEGDETVMVTLSANEAYTVGSPDNATVTIADDDGTLPTITVIASDPTATEAGLTTGQFTITRTGATTSALTAYFSVGGTATSGSDYSSIGTSTTIPAGSASQTITVTPINDTAVEADETVAVSLSVNAAYTVGSPSSATVTITSDDVGPTVTIQANDPTATEAGPTTGSFRISRTGATTSSLRVYFSVGGTATSGSDYTSIGTSVTIPAGSASQTKTVTPIDDTTTEGDESVVVTLSPDAAYAVGSPNSATATITDND